MNGNTQENEMFCEKAGPAGSMREVRGRDDRACEQWIDSASKTIDAETEPKAERETWTAEPHSDGRWVRVTRVENIPVREGRAVNISGREVAIFNLGERFLAVDARCPHKHGPLAEGIVTGATVVCPLHAWKINLETGAVQRPGATVTANAPGGAAFADGQSVAAVAGASTGVAAGSNAADASATVACAEAPCVETFSTRVKDGVILVAIREASQASTPAVVPSATQDRPASFLY